MYSRFDEEADILYVTDQADRALAMKPVFDLGSGTAKKIYKKELNALTPAPISSINDATPVERAAAGEAVMTTVMSRLRRKALPAGVTGLRLYRKTFRLESGGLTELAPEILAERSLPSP